MPTRNNRLGEVRRSQVLGYGPGAIIDFRAGRHGGGPVSVVAASIDTWEKTARTWSSNDPHILRERRLEKVLSKEYFRQPPVDDSDPDDDQLNRYLLGYRFPTWLECPHCHRLQYASKWGKDVGDPSRWCTKCSTGDTRTFVVPVRFVTACENGHLSEFPWHWWLRNRSSKPPTCRSSEDGASRCKLVIASGEGSGLESLIVKCINRGCPASASLAGAFSQDALKGLKCSGERLWIDTDKVECEARPRVLQRGASNLYFPVTFSTLSIPPWSDQMFEDLAPHWQELVKQKDNRQARSILIRAFASSSAAIHDLSEEEYIRRVEMRLDDDENISSDKIRPEEFQQLCMDVNDKNFQVEQVEVPSDLRPLFSNIARVKRLREVRALRGFKRIYPAASDENPGQGQFGELCRPSAKMKWLPAIEVNGEGIFLALRERWFEQWHEANPSLSKRTQEVNEAYRAQWESHHGDTAEFEPITSEFLVVHSLAHILIKRLAFECGYDAAALRERLYVQQDPWMAGLLIYTATSDSDGTLGGLERQGEPKRIRETILTALEDSLWCSSDPLCKTGISSLSENMNLAACHSCLLLPETSCEWMNRFLDRTHLIGDYTSETDGYFSSWFDQLRST